MLYKKLVSKHFIGHKRCVLIQVGKETHFTWNTTENEITIISDQKVTHHFVITLYVV